MVTSQLANHQAVLIWTGANQTSSGLETTMPTLSHRRITIYVNVQKKVFVINPGSLPPAGISTAAGKGYSHVIPKHSRYEN